MPAINEHEKYSAVEMINVLLKQYKKMPARDLKILAAGRIQKKEQYINTTLSKLFREGKIDRIKDKSGKSLYTLPKKARKVTTNEA